MNIGNKIKEARLKANLTQEAVVEYLGVSRQTISNWENEKTYPDIVSVVKMSDLYAVSLDYLLKGENQMSNYLNYIDKSTNLVKSKERQSKLMIIISYLVIWAFAILVFWIFTKDFEAMAYGFVYLWILLPTTTFILSLIIGKNNYWGKYKWYTTIAFAIMYMLAEYATFNAANMISFNKVNLPNFSMILAGLSFSVIGISIGNLLRFYQEKKIK